jgi:hypothetical protein
MTDLHSAQRRTVESGVDLDAPRACQIYRIYTWDHAAWMRGEFVKVLGYIGETGREPLERLLEHLNGARSDGPKPWGDLFAGVVLDGEVYGCKRDVLAAEEAAVIAERPLYNGEYNGRNPGRVSKQEQVRQRAERDRHRGRPGRRPLAVSRPVHQPGKVAASPARAPRARRSRRLVVMRASVWLTLSILAWLPVANYAPLPGWQTAGPVALLVAAVMTATAPDWRARGGWRRSRCEWWAWVLVAAAVAALVAPPVVAALLAKAAL